jgi:ankyrin repeat protein
MEAADLGEVSRVRLLLKMGADPNLADSHGYTALMSAVQHSLPTALELLRSDANPTCARKASGSTALHSLMRRAFSQPLLRLEVLTLMLAVGAEHFRGKLYVNTKCCHASQYATKLEALAHIMNLQDKSGSTLLHEAIFSDNRTFFLIKFLLLNGIGTHAKDK